MRANELDGCYLEKEIFIDMFQFLNIYIREHKDILNVISPMVCCGHHRSQNVNIILFLRPAHVNNQFSTVLFHKVLFSFMINSQCCLSGLNDFTKQLQIPQLAVSFGSQSISL